MEGQQFPPSSVPVQTGLAEHSHGCVFEGNIPGAAEGNSEGALEELGASLGELDSLGIDEGELDSLSIDEGELDSLGIDEGDLDSLGGDQGLSEKQQSRDVVPSLVGQQSPSNPSHAHFGIASHVPMPKQQCKKPFA